MAEQDKEKDETTGRAAVAERRTRAAEQEQTDQPDQPTPPKPMEVVRVDGGIDTRDILGGNIAETVNIPVEAPARDRTRQMELMLRASRAAGTKKLRETLVSRPLEEWGLVGKGDELRGHYILVDLDSLEKVEVIDYWKIDEDRVFANAQQLPKLLMRDNALEQL